MLRPIVLDADAFMAFYREKVLLSPNLDATGSALPVVDVLGSVYLLFIDDGDQILSEWIAVTGDDLWVRSWLSDRLTFGHANWCILLRTPPKLSSGPYVRMGFPRHATFGT